MPGSSLSMKEKKLRDWWMSNPETQYPLLKQLKISGQNVL